MNLLEPYLYAPANLPAGDAAGPEAEGGRLGEASKARRRELGLLV